MDLLSNKYQSFSVWDWEAGVRQNHFYNHNSKTCKITGMEYLNPHNSDRTLLAVATGRYLNTGKLDLVFTVAYIPCHFVRSRAS